MDEPAAAGNEGAQRANVHAMYFCPQQSKQDGTYINRNPDVLFVWRREELVVMVVVFVIKICGAFFVLFFVPLLRFIYFLCALFAGVNILPNPKEETLRAVAAAFGLEVFHSHPFAILL